jgi:hypothetical protein
MARQYDRPPGVKITELSQTTVNPLIATPDKLCLVGPASGVMTTVSEAIKFNGTDPVELRVDKGAVLTTASIVSIMDKDSASAKTSNPAYTSTAGYYNVKQNLNGDTIWPTDVFTFDPEVRSDSGKYQISRAATVDTTTIAANISIDAVLTGAAGHNVEVADARSFDSAGVFVIGKEQFRYTGKSLTSEVQVVTLTNATGGTFTLTFNNQTTGAIAYNADPTSGATSVRGKLEALSNIEPGDVAVTGSAGGPYTVTFAGNLIGNVAELTANGSLLTSAPTVTNTTTTQGSSSPATNEVQSVTVGNATGGTFKLTFNGNETASTIAYNASAATVQTALEGLSAGSTPTVTNTTTTPGTASPAVSEVQSVTIGNVNGGTFKLTCGANETANPIAYDASAATVQSALEGLASIGTGNVTVTKSGTATYNTIATYTITFGGTKANTDMAQVTVSSNLLTNTIGTGNVTVVKSGTSGAGSVATYTITFGGTLAATNVGQITVTTNALTGPTPSVAVSTSALGGGMYFTGVTRAINNSVKEAHTNGNTVSQGYVIPNERVVFITYTYTPADYYKPYKVQGTTFSTIENRFGKAFANDKRTVNSPLTLAAKIAIENGANDFVLQPLFYSEDDVEGDIVNRTRPTNNDITSTTNTWDKTFRSLQNQEDIGVIVPVVGQKQKYAYGADNELTESVTTTYSELSNGDQLSIIQSLQSHIAFMDSEYSELIIGIVGEDSTDVDGDGLSYADRTTSLIFNISQLQSFSYQSQSYNERLVYVAETYFNRNSQTNSLAPIPLGGQYAAAAVGGMLVSRQVSDSLTRNYLSGFKSVQDNRTKNQKTYDSGLGFFVIENNKNGGVQVRHGLTTDIDSVDRSELSVVRAKFNMINSLRQTIDTQVIGKIVADDSAPIVVRQAIAGTLRTLQDNGDIVAFNAVQAQVDSLDPTVIGVRFNYRPAFPVNYVDISFSVDLTNGISSLSTTEQANVGA